MEVYLVWWYCSTIPYCILHQCLILVLYDLAPWFLGYTLLKVGTQICLKNLGMNSSCIKTP